jgi:hypothetical protein
MNPCIWRTIAGACLMSIGLAVSSAHAAGKPNTSVAKKHVTVHSPYARAAALHATAARPGQPVYGHSASMVQGQGMSMSKAHAGRPH